MPIPHGCAGHACRECRESSPRAPPGAHLARCDVCNGRVPNGHLALALEARHRRVVVVCAVVDDTLSPDFPLGDAVEVLVRREDAERVIEEVRGDDPEVAAELRIEEREFEAGGPN